MHCMQAQGFLNVCKDDYNVLMAAASIQIYFEGAEAKFPSPALPSLLLPSPPLPTPPLPSLPSLRSRPLKSS